MERLTAKLTAINAANMAANELAPRLRAVLASFVGKPVLTKPGDLTAKVKAVLPPPAASAPGLRVWRYSSPYVLAWTIQACRVDGNGTGSYHEVTATVGELRDGVLVKLVTQDAYRTDYTEAEVSAKRAAYEAAEQAYRDAKVALYPFGERD